MHSASIPVYDIYLHMSEVPLSHAQMLVSSTFFCTLMHNVVQCLTLVGNLNCARCANCHELAIDSILRHGRQW